jgi:hypothetical protein
VSIMDNAFSHEGACGFKQIDVNEVLGVRRVATQSGGVRYLHLHQAFKAEELWHAFGEERRGKSAPSHPFPIGNGHPLLDNDNQVVGATDSEAFEIHAKKDTEQ